MLKFSIRDVLQNKKILNGHPKFNLQLPGGIVKPVKPLFHLLQLVKIPETRVKYLDRYFQFQAPRLFKVHFKYKQAEVYRSNAAHVFNIVFDSVDYSWPEKNYIRVELVQRNRKNHYLQLYNESNDTVRFWSKKRLTNSFIFYIFQSLFLCAYFAVYTTNIILQYTANHKLYLHSFNKSITPYIKTIYNLNLKFNVNVVISRPNFFYVNFQKKKFGAIKKSRKKLMYLFLPVQQPKLP